jgi:hypothetical protein
VGYHVTDSIKFQKPVIHINIATGPSCRLINLLLPPHGHCNTFSKAEAIAPSWLHGCMAWACQFLVSFAARRGVAAADRSETLVVLAASEMQVYNLGRSNPLMTRDGQRSY